MGITPALSGSAFEHSHGAGPTKYPSSLGTKQFSRLRHQTRGRALLQGH